MPCCWKLVCLWSVATQNLLLREEPGSCAAFFAEILSDYETKLTGGFSQTYTRGTNTGVTIHADYGQHATVTSGDQLLFTLVRCAGIMLCAGTVLVPTKSCTGVVFWFVSRLSLVICRATGHLH